MKRGFDVAVHRGIAHILQAGIDPGQIFPMDQDVHIGHPPHGEAGIVDFRQGDPLEEEMGEALGIESFQHDEKFPAQARLKMRLASKRRARACTVSAANRQVPPFFLRR